MKIHSNYLKKIPNDQYYSPIYKLDFPIFDKRLRSIAFQYWRFSRKYFILWDIVNPQLGSGLGLGSGSGLGLGLGLGSGLGLDSLRGSTISHKMKYLPFFQRHTAGSNDRTLVFHQKWRKMRKLRETIYEKVFSACKVETTLSPL